jgi:hypothetical protein
MQAVIGEAEITALPSRGDAKEGIPCHQVFPDPAWSGS